MSGDRLRILMPIVVAGLAFALLAMRYFQLPLSLGLAALYLFWGYIEAAVILITLLFWLFLMPTRWPVLLLILALAVDFLIPFVRDYQANTAASTSGPTLKVITYNWLGQARDRSEIYDWIEKQDPDILAIQEMSGREPGVEERLYTQFPYHTRPSPDLMIFTRFPIISQRATPLEEHSIVAARLAIGDRRMTVWGVHPSTLRTLPELAARNYYLATLADLVPVDRNPVVMLGDFNATRWDPYFTNVVREAGLHEEPMLLPPPTRMGIRSGLPQFGAPIDHILTNGTNVLSDCQTGPAMGSDHRPLICHLTLQN